nr:hypothetical protein [uncultured Noviherbaspirillum sp.]
MVQQDFQRLLAGVRMKQAYVVVLQKSGEAGLRTRPGIDQEYDLTKGRLGRRIEE